MRFSFLEFPVRRIGSETVAGDQTFHLIIGWVEAESMLESIFRASMAGEDCDCQHGKDVAATHQIDREIRPALFLGENFNERS
jgi:hypothetical protein